MKDSNEQRSTYYPNSILSSDQSGLLQTEKSSRQNFQEYRAQRSEFLEYQKNENKSYRSGFFWFRKFSVFFLKKCHLIYRYFSNFLVIFMDYIELGLLFID